MGNVSGRQQQLCNDDGNNSTTNNDSNNYKHELHESNDNDDQVSNNDYSLSKETTDATYEDQECSISTTTSEIHNNHDDDIMEPSTDGIICARNSVTENNNLHHNKNRSLNDGNSDDNNDDNEDNDDDDDNETDKKVIEKSFVQKLHQILCTPSFHTIITWLPNGRDFKILQPKLLESKVLPLVFHHSNYNAFVRQLNSGGWGFKRVNYHQYYHKLFLRDHPELCERIKQQSQSEAATNTKWKRSVAAANTGYYTMTSGSNIFCSSCNSSINREKTIGNFAPSSSMLQQNADSSTANNPTIRNRNNNKLYHNKININDNRGGVGGGCSRVCICQKSTDYHHDIKQRESIIRQRLMMIKQQQQQQQLHANIMKKQLQRKQMIISKQQQKIGRC